MDNNRGETGYEKVTRESMVNRGKVVRQTEVVAFSIDKSFLEM